MTDTKPDPFPALSRILGVPLTEVHAMTRDDLVGVITAQADQMEAAAQHERPAMTETATTSTVRYDRVSQGYTGEFTRGYALAVDWLTKGAPIIEALQLQQIHLATRPGSPVEGASHLLDADRFPALLAHLGDQVEVFYGQDYEVEQGWVLGRVPERAFCWHAGEPRFEGFMTAVHQVLED